MSEIVVMVERLKKEKWDSFRDHQGDVRLGRQNVNWVAD